MERGQILDEAKTCVLQDRNKSHGDPEDNFAIIANYWNNYLQSKGVFISGDVKRITATDVAAMMILVKVSRMATSPSLPDHWIDIAGYAACGGQIATRVNSDGKAS